MRVEGTVYCLERPPSETSFHTWVDLYYADVYRWCYRYTQDPEQASDLTQETFLQAFSARETFRGDASPKTWLLAIATRTYLRAARRVRRQEQLVQAHTEHLDVSADSAEEAALRNLARADLIRWLWELPPRQRVAITLHVTDDLSYNEVAHIMGISVHQVRNFLHRGRQHLQRLRQDGPDDGRHAAGKGNSGGLTPPLG